MKQLGSSRRVALDLLKDTATPDVYNKFSKLEERDKALVKRLVSGVQRWKRLLDYYIADFSHRPLSKITRDVLDVLRLGTYQMLFTRIPTYASVNSAVQCIRVKSRRGFVNGVLRAMARNLGHIEMPCLDEVPKKYAAVRYSFPDWIVDRYIEEFGLKDTLILLKTQNMPPPITLRVNQSKISRDCFLSAMLQNGFSAYPGLTDISIRVTGGRSVTVFPGFHEGLFSVQNEGATMVTNILAPKPGDVVWDMCAAPGGKSTHIAELVHETGLVVASDVDDSRLDLILDSVKRLEISNIKVAVLDGTDINHSLQVLKCAALPLEYDRVLVDAPCSGLGVIGKHPEIKWRRKQSDICAMAKRQALLLDTAAHFLKSGGYLVYSTCTLMREENQEVWNGFLTRHGEFAPVNKVIQLNRDITVEMKNGCVFLLPHVHGTDGFFIAKAQKN